MMLVILVISLLVMGHRLLEGLCSVTLANSISKSNSDMKEMRFNSAYCCLMKSPFWGYNVTYSWNYVVSIYAKDALRLEHCCFPIMNDREFLGCFAYLTGCLKTLVRKNIVFFFVFIGWLIASRILSLFGLNEIFCMLQE